jgi:hypothetical protein
MISSRKGWGSWKALDQPHGTDHLRWVSKWGRIQKFFLRAPNYGYCASKVFRSWVCLIPSFLLTYQSLGYVLDQFRKDIGGEGCLYWYICVSGVIRICITTYHFIHKFRNSTSSGPVSPMDCLDLLADLIFLNVFVWTGRSRSWLLRRHQSQHTNDSNLMIL